MECKWDAFHFVFLWREKNKFRCCLVAVCRPLTAEEFIFLFFACFHFFCLACPGKDTLWFILRQRAQRTRSNGSSRTNTRSRSRSTGSTRCSSSSS